VGLDLGDEVLQDNSWSKDWLIWLGSDSKRQLLSMGVESKIL